jgi:hypothetical protein
MYLRIILPLILAFPAFSQVSALPDPGAASAATPPDPSLAGLESSQRRYLLGDWGGKRTSLAEKGVTFDFFYTFVAGRVDSKCHAQTISRDHQAPKPILYDGTEAHPGISALL